MAPRVDTHTPDCLVVGIAGGSASGKSTLTSALLRALAEGDSPLGTEVLSADQYFLPPAMMPKFTSPATGQELPDYNHPDAIDYARLVADLETRCRAGDKPRVLMIEGLMVLHVPAVRERLDLRLFIELDADERALRRLVRNLEHPPDSPIGVDAQSIAHYYLESARVGHRQYVEPSRAYADFILRGDGDFSRTAPMIASIIRARLRSA